MAAITVNGCKDISDSADNEAKMVNFGAKTQNHVDEIKGDNTSADTEQSSQNAKSVTNHHEELNSEHLDSEKIEKHNDELNKSKNLNGTNSQDGDNDQSMEEDGDDKYSGFGIRPHNANRDETMDSPPRMVFSLAGFAPLTDTDEIGNKHDKKMILGETQEGSAGIKTEDEGDHNIDNNVEIKNEKIEDNDLKIKTEKMENSDLKIRTEKVGDDNPNVTIENGEDNDLKVETEKVEDSDLKVKTEKMEDSDLKVKTEKMEDEIKIKTENVEAEKCTDLKEEVKLENENVQDNLDKNLDCEKKDYESKQEKCVEDKVENDVECKMEVDTENKDNIENVEIKNDMVDKDKHSNDSDIERNEIKSPDVTQLDNEGCSDREEMQNDEGHDSIVILDEEEKSGENSSKNSENSSIVKEVNCEIKGDNGQKIGRTDIVSMDIDKEKEHSNNDNSVLTVDEKQSSAESSKAKSKSGMNDTEDKSRDSEKSGKTSGKSVEKVMDVDGSEIVITINEDEEESGDDSGKDADDESEEDEDDKERKKKIQNKTSPVKSSHVSEDNNKNNNSDKDVVVLDGSPAEDKSKVDSSGKVSATANAPAKKEIIYKLPSGNKTILSCPPGYGGQQNSQYFKVMGQGQQAFYMPVSSRYVVTTGTNQAPIVAGPITVAVGDGKNQPFFTQQVTPSTGKPAETSKSTNIDDDIASSSWEQLELIKYEIATRKPDNTFWMGLANVNKKADLSSVTKFLFDLGSDIVKESAYKQIVHVQNKKLESGKLNTSEKESLEKMKTVVKDLKEKVGCFDMKQRRCKCGFQTTSKNVMQLHKEYPHMSPPHDVHGVMNCAHCDFSTKLPTAYTYHMNAEHNMTGRIYEKPAFHQCNLCQFENNSKPKLTQHSGKCTKNYKPHLNQAPYHFDISYCLKNIFYKFQIKKPSQPKPDLRTKAIPAKPPMIQPKAAARMPVYTGPPVRPQVTNRFVLGPNQNVYRLNIPGQNQYHQQFQRFALAPPNQRPPLSVNKQLPRPQQPMKPIQFTGKPTVGQLLQQKTGVRSTVAPVTNPQIQPRPQVGKQQSQSPSQNQGSGGFEVCEMCGGYVKDKMSLRIHFYYAHKIDMPASIFNRQNPPLKCDVCKKMFWTTQGLTKHKQTMKHNINPKPSQPSQALCWICHQKPDNLYSHLHKFHKLTTSECMALKRCMFCGTLCTTRKELEIHMAAAHGVLIKGEVPSGNTSKPPSSSTTQSKPNTAVSVSTRTVVTGSGATKANPGLVRNNFCVFCSKQFSDNTQLTLHCLRDHATCSGCGMVVNRASDLKTHVCKVNRSRICEVCGIKNLKSVYYTKHVTTHLKKCSVKLKRLSQEEIDTATKRRKTNETVTVDIEIISDSESDGEKKKTESSKSAIERKSEVKSEEVEIKISGDESDKEDQKGLSDKKDDLPSVDKEKDNENKISDEEGTKAIESKKEENEASDNGEVHEKSKEDSGTNNEKSESGNRRTGEETKVEDENNTEKEMEKDNQEVNKKEVENSEEKVAGFKRKSDDNNDDDDDVNDEDNPPKKRLRSSDKPDNLTV